MSKKKKTKGKQKKKTGGGGGPTRDSTASAAAHHGADYSFAEQSLEELDRALQSESGARDYAFECDVVTRIAGLEDLGAHLRVDESTPPDPLLAKLEPLVSPEVFRALRESGAFTDVTLDVDEIPADEQSALTELGRVSAGWLPAAVPVRGEPPELGSSQTLATELRYLNTILQPAEMRALVGELACDVLEASPITHTDVSDAVIASIAPSTAQKIAFQADAQYKYTTAQFLQVYMKMRHVVLEQKLMLAGARADALVLATAPHRFDPPTRDEDAVPLSAVDALRAIIDAPI